MQVMQENLLAHPFGAIYDVLIVLNLDHPGLAKNPGFALLATPFSG